MQVVIKVFEKWKRLLTCEWVWDIVKLMGSLFGAEFERAVNVHKSEMDSLYISDNGLGVL